MIFDDFVKPTTREEQPRRRVYPRTTGKPRHALRIPQTEVSDPKVRKIREVQSEMTGENEERVTIELPNGLLALKVAAREFVFVEEQDVATVAAYRWQIRAINSFNGAYKGCQTWWDESEPGKPMLRYRMWLHDLLMDTPFWTKSASHELDGPRWIVRHIDSSGMNCSRKNMELVESPDGYVPIPTLNLPCGVWWNYRRHKWTGRIMAEGKWYVELGLFTTFEEAAVTYFEAQRSWTPDQRKHAQYAWGTPITYKGGVYTFDEWQEIREQERREAGDDAPVRIPMTAEEIEERAIRVQGGRGPA